MWSIEVFCVNGESDASLIVPNFVCDWCRWLRYAFNGGHQHVSLAGSVLNCSKSAASQVAVGSSAKAPLLGTVMRLAAQNKILPVTVPVAAVARRSLVGRWTVDCSILVGGAFQSAECSPFVVREALFWRQLHMTGVLRSEDCAARLGAFRMTGSE